MPGGRGPGGPGGGPIEEEKYSKEQNKAALKRFVKYFKPVIGYFIMDSIFAIILAGVAVGTPFITQYIIHALSNGGPADMEAVYIGIGLLVSALVVRMFSNFIVTYWGHMMGVKMEVAMRGDAVKKLHKLKMSHFDKTSTGTFISRIVSDLKDIPEFSHHGPEDLLIATVTATGGLTYAFLQSWIVGVILTGVMLIGMIIIYFIRSSWRKIWTKIRVHTSRMSASIGQQVEAATETKSFASEDYEIKRFNDLHKDYTRTFKAFYKFEGFFTVSNIVIMASTTLITLAVGAILVSNHTIRIDQLVGLTSAAAILNQPMQKFVNVYTMISRGASAVVRFYEFMDLPEEMNYSKVEAPAFKGHIQFKNVDFSYLDEDNKVIDVLKNFSVDIKPGNKIAFVGETGIGKSTILKLILRFYEVNKGEILVDGKNIKDYEITSLRKRIGYIQQHATMFEDSIENNIRYGRPDATVKELKAAAKGAFINDFITKLANGYKTIAGPRGAKLSGGQKQRVSIARTFLAGSSIMLMDEATSALDNDTEAKIKKSTEKLTKGKTTLIVAHRLSTIKDVDRVLVIGRGGIILEDGSHETLMKNKAHYFELYNK